MNRWTNKNELTFQGDVDYSESDNQMDAQKWSNSVRWAYSFGKDLKWYNFYKYEIDHDRFSDVNVRHVPSIGVGYWHAHSDDFKLLGEVAVGYEYTDYNTKENEDKVLPIPRIFLEKKIFDRAILSEDFKLYLSVDEPGRYRFKSETALDNPLTDKLSLSIKVIDEYNSKPGNNTKKNDLRVVSGLTYTF